MCSLSSHILLPLVSGWMLLALWTHCSERCMVASQHSQFCCYWQTREHHIWSGYPPWCSLSLMHFRHPYVHVPFPPNAGLDPRDGPDPVHTYNYVIITSPDTSGWCRTSPWCPPGPVSWASHLQPSTAKGYLLLSLASGPLWNKERWIKASQVMKSKLLCASGLILFIAYFLRLWGKWTHVRTCQRKRTWTYGWIDKVKDMKWGGGGWKEGAGSKDMRKWWRSW